MKIWIPTIVFANAQTIRLFFKCFEMNLFYNSWGDESSGNSSRLTIRNVSMSGTLIKQILLYSDKIIVRVVGIFQKD